MSEYVCINGHRNDHTSHGMCATRGCRAEAEIEDTPDPWPLVRELAKWGCMFEDGEIPACPYNKQLQASEWCLPCRADAALELREAPHG
jgi:hypothetical protein